MSELSYYLRNMGGAEQRTDSKVLKKHRLPFESLRANGKHSEIVEHFPFVLSESKHSEAFFNNLLGKLRQFLALEKTHQLAAAIDAELFINVVKMNFNRALADK